MAEQIEDKIIRKIQLLLNLGNKATNEHEAALAMGRAQELLAKYNLDMASIEAAKVEGGAAPSKEKREQTKIDRSAMYKWQRELCRAIAEANYCWYWVVEMLEDEERVSAGKSYRHRVRRHMIIGKESNVVAVTCMYGWLAELIEDLCPYRDKQRNSKSGISWKEGCAERLGERIKAKAHEMQHPAESSATAVKETGLMIRSLVKTEYEANYDAMYGDGAYARAMEAQAKWKAQQDAQPQPEKSAAEKEKEAKASKRWWEKYQRQQQRELAKKDLKAYNAGRVVGDEIQLGARLNEMASDEQAEYEQHAKQLMETFPDGCEDWETPCVDWACANGLDADRLFDEVTKLVEAA
jgi:hypothetical protein